MTYAFTDRQILVDGAPHLVQGGEYQYFRIRRDLWRPCLEKLRDAGLDSISAYVPWVWHEVEEGRFDFTGETDPSRDLVGFLELTAELGLPVVIKPGPYIFAEYQGFGVPLWLQTNHPEVLMVVHKAQEYPQPSLNHPGYLALVRTWFERVADVIRPWVANGHVIAIQVDNETGYPQFGQGPHLTDKNPEALTLLRTALADHFSSVEELNLRWGTHFASFDEVEPPEERLYNEGQLDTMARWVEDYIVDYLRRLQGIWDDIGLPTHYFTNDIWLDSWPSHIGKKNKVAPVAYDIYPRYSELPVTFDQPYCISYVPKLFGAFVKGGPLMCAEMGCGWLDPACEVTPAATYQSTMAAYAHGTKAVYYYILQDGRDPDGDYVFNPFIDIEGRETPRLEVARKVAAFRRQWGRAVAATEAVNSPVAILHYPAVTREMMSAAIDPMGAVLRGSHRPVDEAMTIVSVNAGLYGALAESGYQPEVRNLDVVSTEELDRYQVVFFNSIGLVDPASQRKLAEYVRRGGKLVTLGTPFSEDTALFPARVSAVANPQAGWVMAKIAWDFVKLYVRIARKFKHKFCAYTVEGMYPAMLMTKHATRAGMWVKDQAFGTRLWASRLVTLSKPTGDAKPLWTHGSKVAAYEATVERGRSVFLGTLLGAAFDSPGYYLDDPARKRSVADFLGRLLESWGLRPLATPAADLETVVREGADHRTVFVFNRGPAKPFTTSLAIDWKGWRLAGQHGGAGTTARWEGHAITGTLAADDVAVLIWERTPAAEAPPEPAG